MRLLGRLHTDSQMAIDLLFGVFTAIDVCGTMGDPEDASSLQLERRMMAYGTPYLRAATGWRLTLITVNGGPPM